MRQVITGLVSILLDAILQSSGGGGGGSSGRLRRAFGRGEEAGQGGAGRGRVPPEASCTRARAGEAVSEAISELERALHGAPNEGTGPGSDCAC